MNQAQPGIVSKTPLGAQHPFPVPCTSSCSAATALRRRQRSRPQPLHSPPYNLRSKAQRRNTMFDPNLSKMTSKSDTEGVCQITLSSLVDCTLMILIK